MHFGDRLKPVTQLSDIPKIPHYVIVEIGSVHIPGDERSRTNPWHGYPAETRYYPSMRVTTDKEVWEGEVTRLTRENPKETKFVAYHVDAIATIKTSIQVEI